MLSEYPHTAAATIYCEQVVAGEIVAGELTRLACRRQLDDLERADADPDWPYRFDPDAAERVCKFVSLLPHVKGKWARRKKDDPTAHLIRLEPCEQFILTTIFGWKHRDSGLRRFTKAYLEVARKNFKSTLAATVLLYMLALDNEPGAECYTAATKKDQAKIVLKIAQAMARRSTEYRNRWGVEPSAHAIAHPGSGSTAQALDAKSSTQDGLNVHLVVNDEVHAYKSRKLYDVLHSGMSGREQPLEFNITTAGSNQAGICYELRADLVKVIQGQACDESLFGVIYTIDKGDEWTDERIWPKANPMLGVSKNVVLMRQDCAKAIRSPGAQNEFMCKHLNMWVNAATAWMTMQAWDACADPGLRLEDFEGEPCFMGLDLSTKRDITSRAMIFKRGRKVYVFAKHYLPEKEIMANPDYAGWAKQGWITTTPGNAIDLDQIEEDVLAVASDYQVEEIAYDPWQATHLVQHLMAAGATVVETKPTVQNFSEPMKELEALVVDGRLVHNGDPVLAWMISNVVCFRDNKDNIYPRKEQPANKIDGVVALIMALARMTCHQDDAKSIYETRGLVAA